MTNIQIYSVEQVITRSNDLDRLITTRTEDLLNQLRKSLSCIAISSTFVERTVSEFADL